MFTLRDINEVLLAGVAGVVAWAVWRVLWLSISKRSPERQSVADRREQLQRGRQERARRSQGLGALLLLFAVAVWPIAFGAVVAVEWFDPGLNVIAIGILGLGAPITSGVLWRRGRQLRLPIVDRESLARGRPQVLYLRPFIVDHLDRRSRLGRQEMFPKTNLERVERALLPIADLVALGDPTDRLPPLGTKPVYAGDERWQQTVREMTSEASTIIFPTYLIPEDASGFAWEVEHVVGLGAPEGIIFLLTPPDVNAVLLPELEKRYTAFRKRFSSLFPRNLPEAIGGNNLMYFDADWTPRLLGYFDVNAADIEVPHGRSGHYRTLVLRQLIVAFGHPNVARFAKMMQRRTSLQRAGILVLLFIAGLIVFFVFLMLLVSLTLIGR